MSATHIQTKSLKLVPQTLEEVRAMVEAMAPSDKAQLSADWLTRLHASTAADPWAHGFSLVHRVRDIVVGKGGFKGPPTADGIVEIAYAVERDHEGRGWAGDTPRKPRWHWQPMLLAAAEFAWSGHTRCRNGTLRRGS